jgi:tetratricopeptide (TPR) repeat protein
MNRLKPALLIIALAITAQIQPRNEVPPSREELIKKRQVEASEYPESPEALYKLGEAYLLYGNIMMAEDAIEAFKKAILIKPHFAEAHYRLGEAYHKSHIYKLLPHPNEEREAFLRAIEIKPDYAEAYVELGWTFIPTKPSPENASYYSKAEELYRRAIEINPNYIDAHLALCKAYLLQEKDEEFLRMCQKIIQIAPENLSAYDLLRSYCSSMGRCEYVANIFKDIIRANPRNSIAYCYLGKTYRSLRRSEEAINVFKECLEINPQDGEARFGLGRAYLDVGNQEDASRELSVLRKLAQGVNERQLKLTYEELAIELDRAIQSNREK